MKEIRLIRPVRRMMETMLFCPLALALSAGLAWAGPVVDLPDRPAVMTKGAAHSVLLDVTQAGPRLVAVGERGIIVLSDDGGKTWRQAKVPTSVSLTAVAFPSPKLGWATGHGGTVLRSEDGGETWTRQLDGKSAAKLALESARARLQGKPADAAAQRAVADAERLVADGPDKPFLDLYFENETTGYVVGAYNLVFRTEDGGKSWKPWLDHVDNPKGLHLYAMQAAGKTLFLAGEQGLFLRSTDGGKSFQRIETPYKGTWFTLTGTPSGELVLAGLRGNAYRTADGGKTFTRIDVALPISFSATTMLADGRMILANQAGMLFESRDQGKTVQTMEGVRLPPVAALTPTSAGSLVTVGFAGALKIPMPGTAPGSEKGAPR